MRNRTHAGDVIEGIAQLNPVTDEHLDAAQSARADDVLARIIAPSVSAAGVSAAGADAGSREPHPEKAVRASTGMHIAPTPTGPRRHVGSRRLVRGVAVALASVLGLGAAAYATGVTLGSVSEGVKALNSADMGTVTYSDTHSGGASAVLEGIARNAAVSGDLGDTHRIVVSHSLESGDEWHSDDTGPGTVTQERWDWTLDGGVRRYRTVETSREGTNPDARPIDMYLEELPPDPNPLYHPEKQLIGRDVVLGDTPSDTVSTLLQDLPADSAGAPYAVVDAYVSHWSEGIGLRATNRAAFARALATLDPVHHGAATDQLGRRGEAFGVHWRSGDGDEEYRVVLDPDTGALLAAEQVLHGPWILGSQDHVGWSRTMVSLETVDSVPACADIAGCEVAKIG